MNIKVTAFAVSEKSIKTWSGNFDHKSYVYSCVFNVCTIRCRGSGPITQHSGDSQISYPSIPSLTLYELSHCAS